MLPELPLQEPLLQFTLLIGIVLLVQLALERLFVPALLGLLVAGTLLGPDGMGVLPREPVVSLLGDIGLVYIMFLAGLEIDLDVVRRHRGETVMFGLLAFVFSFALGAGAGWVLDLDVVSMLMLGALLSSHTLIAYPMLKKLALLRRRESVTAIGGTIVTDTLALLMLVVLLQLAGGGDQPQPWWLPLAGLVVLAAVALLGLPWLARRLFARGWITPAERSLFALLALLMLSVAAEQIGTEKILGAFLAGLGLNRVLAEHRDTRGHVEFVGRMLFMPIFFVSTGMQLDVDALTGSAAMWGIAGLLCAVVLFGKSGAAWLIGTRCGYPLAGRVLMVSLTLPQAAATLAITMAAREAGLLDARIVDAVIVVILLTCAAGPLLTHAAAQRLGDPAAGSREAPASRENER